MEMTQTEVEYVATLIHALKTLEKEIGSDITVVCTLTDIDGSELGTVSHCDFGDYGFKPAS
jgi:hypothetical protein